MRVAVFCSSSDRVDPEYVRTAEDVGRKLADRGHELVWGGGRLGLMGAVARGAQDRGGRIVGVIPESMMSVEVAYTDADELLVVADMRTRKQEMDQRSDAFLILPGGFGTLEELSEILVGRVLAHHMRPVVLLDDRGFYRPLLDLFDHFVEHGFAVPGHLAHLRVVETVDRALEAVEAGNPSPHGR
ncbi:MAG: TIGR00730 family Rossman fold protein [Planctomycetota bacterium]